MTARRSRGPRLVDLLSVVVGYGLAAVLVRAFWPAGEATTIGTKMVLGLVYSWLGLAMAGPVVLLVDRRQRPEPGRSVYTWAETAWLLIGGYWIVLTLFILPANLRQSPLLGVLPILVAVGLRLLGPKRAAHPSTSPGPGWTHHGALVLIGSWPVVWLGMMLLSKTF